RYPRISSVFNISSLAFTSIVNSNFFNKENIANVAFSKNGNIIIKGIIYLFTQLQSIVVKFIKILF
ncbi:hypothetical protein, partial [Streptococcus constellatus]|uniref:hypothetical protein n=1 Tax=Streptococcus constellatus TaxID=76860 RepID=UPI0005624412